MEIVGFDGTGRGPVIEHRDYVPFGTAHLAEMAADCGGDLPLRIASHGEAYEVSGFSYDPHENVITLSGSDPHNASFLALSFDGDPAATAQLHHQEAGKLARHLEELAAGIRARCPAPDVRPG